IIDLTDCFFTIPPHPDEQPRFAFSIPSINNQAPMKRYQWTVLPRGMMNSPTICQLVVSTAIEPTRIAFKHLIIYHYVDDILVAAQAQIELRGTVNHLK
ncbi:POK8 protein, partial [Psophia crepitans]|nr:POK8 protein [Psophia crepitans]